MPLATARPRRRLAAACLLAAAAFVPFGTSASQAGATDTSCWTQALTPDVHVLNGPYAKAAAYSPCGAYITLKLVTSTGAVLVSQDFNVWHYTTTYTKYVYCAPGTVVHSYVTSRSNTSFPWSGGVSNSASVTCY
jgi:hypothetical protein